MPIDWKLVQRMQYCRWLAEYIQSVAYHPIPLCETLCMASKSLMTLQNAGPQQGGRCHGLTFQCPYICTRSSSRLNQMSPESEVYHALLYGCTAIRIHCTYFSTAQKRLFINSACHVLGIKARPFERSHLCATKTSWSSVTTMQPC